MSTPLLDALRAKQAEQAAAATAEAKAPEVRVFFGDLPESVSFLTPRGLPVYFYKGYHISSDPEVIETCNSLPNVADVTEMVKLEDVPTPPVRSRQRSWSSNDGTEPHQMTPAELLKRVVVANSANIGEVAAQSTSGG